MKDRRYSAEDIPSYIDDRESFEAILEGISQCLEKCYNNIKKSYLSDDENKSLECTIRIDLIPSLRKLLNAYVIESKQVNKSFHNEVMTLDETKADYKCKSCENKHSREDILANENSYCCAWNIWRYLTCSIGLCFLQESENAENLLQLRTAIENTVESLHYSANCIESTLDGINNFCIFLMHVPYYEQSLLHEWSEFLVNKPTSASQLPSSVFYPNCKSMSKLFLEQGVKGLDHGICVPQGPHGPLSYWKIFSYLRRGTESSLWHSVLENSLRRTRSVNSFVRSNVNTFPQSLSSPIKYNNKSYNSSEEILSLNPDQMELFNKYSNLLEKDAKNLPPNILLKLLHDVKGDVEG